jgi:voltage-gated potassium channel
MLTRQKTRVNTILDKAAEGDTASRTADTLIMVLIVLNVIMVVLETVQDLEIRFGAYFAWFELVSVVVFTVEYLLRIWASTSDGAFQGSIVGRLRYATTPMALIDLIAILPFYLPMLFGVDLRVIRALRLFRLLRLFKLGRYSVAMQTLANVLRDRREELYVTIFVLLIMLVIASSLMYFVENEAQPEAFSSIPSAMWWGMVTLTTVGYGDAYPVTSAGKVLGAAIALMGIGMFALPAGILGSGFAEEIQRRKKGNLCPHCGKHIDDPPS